MPVSSKLRLMYSPVQQVFMFVFGDSPQRMGIEPLYFKTKREAITAARRQGLDVDKKGYVKSYLMVEMEALLSKRGYDPADAELLMSEGIGPTELEERLKRAPGSVGSLEYTHRLKKVRQDRGLDGVSPRSRKGTRVRFNASPGSLVLYNHHPDIGEEGTVTTMPGFGQRTYLPGPGGGLLYVYWDQSGTIGVSPNDVEKINRKDGLGDTNDEPWVRLDYGVMPSQSVFDKQFDTHVGRSPARYPMSLNPSDYKLVHRMVGIRGFWANEKQKSRNHMDISFDKQQLRNLVRVLNTLHEDAHNEDAGNLASSILRTLNIEWI